MQRGRPPTVLLVTLIATLSCAREPAQVVNFDLVAGLPLADIHTTTLLVDLGRPETRWHLESGWAQEGWDENKLSSYVLSRGRESVLRFRSPGRQTATIRLYGRPSGELPDLETQFEVLINGDSMGSAVLIADRFKRYRFRVPGSHLRPGTNKLAVRWLTPDDAPMMAWHELEVSYATELPPPPPTTLQDGESILLPYGARIDYHLRIPEAARFEAQRIGFLGGAAAGLQITLEEDGRGAIQLATVEAPADDMVIDLSPFGSRVVKLSFEAIASAPQVSKNSGVVLTAARLTSRPGDVATVVQPAAAQTGLTANRAAGGPNILLYVVDALRADHLGVYGYSRSVSPHLDRLAQQATVFENCIAQSSWTRASMASLFTGLWPIRHDTNGRRDGLAPQARTLAELLHDAGYETVAIAANPNIFPVFGFNQGFERYREVPGGASWSLHRVFDKWLDSRDPQRPFFVWMHAIDPHTPYDPPPEFRDRFYRQDGQLLGHGRHPGFKITELMSEEERARWVAHLKDLYDGEIASNDQRFGNLIDQLKQRQILDETVVIFTSDHGEEFLEHGTWEHGRNLHAESLNVPLVIRFPGRGQGRRVKDLVQHADLFPTILESAAVPAVDGIEGRSLLNLVDQFEVRSPEDTVFSYLHLDGAPYASVVDANWKLIQRFSGEAVVWTGLYNRADDLQDTQNLVVENQIYARFLELLLDAKMSQGGDLNTTEAVLDKATEDSLKALGYLQ